MDMVVNTSTSRSRSRLQFVEYVTAFIQHKHYSMKLFIIVLLLCFPLTTIFGQSYLFYLNGKIIENQGRNAVDTVNGYGAYQYDDILNAFRKAGFIVLSEVRQRQTNPFEYAHKMVNQIDSLVKKGVSPNDITVVAA